MTTSFPTGLDSFNNPTAANNLNDAGVVHNTQHDNINDAVTAVETKLGVNSSAVTTSIDYLLKNSSSLNPGHLHSVSSLSATGTPSSSTYLRGDGSWSSPSGSGTVTSVSVVSANGLAGTVATATSTPAITLSTSITGVLKGNGTAISAATAGTDYQAPITLTTTGSSGAATFSGNTLNIPQYTGGGGGTPGGTSGQIQYNNAGSFGGFTASGDVTINTSTGATAVAAINGTTVSGTTGTGNVVFSASPTHTGTLTAANITASGELILSQAGAASTPTLDFTGAPYTGGSGTTTLPLLIFQPTGTTAASTWSTAGTFLGFNLPSGYTGNVIDLHSNGGISLWRLDQGGDITTSGTISCGAITTSTGGTVTINSTSGLFWSGRTKLTSPADGILLMTNTAGTGFTRIEIGGSTSSAVAISASGNTLTITNGDGTAGSSLACGNFQPIATQSTLNGTTAGTVISSQPFQGSSYKLFYAYANGYENNTATNQTITFPTAFTNIPIVTGNNTGLTITVSTTILTITAPNNTTTFTGNIVVEGA